MLKWILWIGGGLVGVRLLADAGVIGQSNDLNMIRQAWERCAEQQGFLLTRNEVRYDGTDVVVTIQANDGTSAKTSRHTSAATALQAAQNCPGAFAAAARGLLGYYE